MVATVTNLSDAHRLMLRYLTEERPLNLDEMRVIDGLIAATINNASPIVNSLPLQKMGGTAYLNNFMTLRTMIGK